MGRFHDQSSSQSTFLLNQDDIVNLFYTLSPVYSLYPPRAGFHVMAISYKVSSEMHPTKIVGEES